jgi:1,4-dihydroxy-2-naphthoate octaprenyltransferase
MSASATTAATTQALTTLVRPRMLPLMWMAVFFGFMVGHWESGVHFRGGPAFALALLAWTTGHAGTMWLNAARDRDDGPVAFGRAVRVPAHTARFGYGALALTLVFAAPAGPVVLGCAALTVVLSILYSHPATAWKGHPIGGPVVNIVGYGILTPLAGLAASNGTVSIRTVAIFVIMALCIGGLYFAAQAFQQEEDQSRGDRTLVATHGPQVVLTATRTCFMAAGTVALTGTLLGWFPRSCLVGLPLVWHVDRHLVHWRAQPGGGSPADAKQLVRRLLLLLFVLVTAAVVEYVWDQLHGAPPAGLNTAVVPQPWFALP